MATLSAVLITRNEATRVAACLESLRFADEIVVIDDESQDDTVAVCLHYTEKVLVHAHVGDNWDLNKNVGMDQASGQWILLVDADERVSEATAARLKAFLATDPPAAAYWLPRREHYFGFHARHAASQAKVLRLFRKGVARFEGDRLHAHPLVEGEIGELDAPLEHLAYDTIADYIEKTNRYTDHEARARYAMGQRASARNMILEPLKFFRFRYFKLKGYKDGMPGLVFCLVTSLYPFLQYLKLWELARRVEAGVPI